MYILLRILILNVIKRVFEMYNKLYLKIDIKLYYYFNLKKIFIKVYNFDDLEKGLCFVLDMVM